MYIRFKASDYMQKEVSTEISTFKGIRYDARGQLAILSTEHNSHDYLMPVSPEIYELMSSELYGCMSKALMRPGFQIEIVGSPLIRVPHGSHTKVDNVNDYHYEIQLTEPG